MSKLAGTPGQFSLSAGGLFHLVQRWIRGPESADFPIPAQILIATVLLWLPLVLLSYFDGTLIGSKVSQPLLSDIVPHVRLLLAIPLLLVADVFIDPAASSAARDLTIPGVVPIEEQSRLHSAIEKLRGARDSVWPDVVIILLAFAITWLFKSGYGDSALEAISTSWLRADQGGTTRLSAAGWWYVLISGPMFQVILFRWLWRFTIWTLFLFRVSRLSLALQPTNPDLSGGLGYLGLAQQSFVAVFFAFATVTSSIIAYDILSEGSRFQDELLPIAGLVVLFVAIIYGPLLFFTGRLVVARRRGLRAYGLLSYKLSAAFHEKWIVKENEIAGKELLASPDASAMADYSATYDNVRSMRPVPASLRGVVSTIGVLTVPFLPLALTEFSIQDLLERLSSALI